MVSDFLFQISELFRISGFVFRIFIFCSCLGSCAFASDQVCINTKCVDVEVANTPQELMKGLQNRADLGRDSGMLFVFDYPARHRFWMKETLLVLDMIWIDAGGQIVHIETGVKPCTEEPCPTYGPPEEASYVLEVNAGFTGLHNINVGDRVDFRIPDLKR